MQRCCAAAGNNARLCTPAKCLVTSWLVRRLQHGGGQLRGRTRRHQQARRALRDALLLPQVAGGLSPGLPRPWPSARGAVLTGRSALPGLNQALLCSQAGPHAVLSHPRRTPQLPPVPARILLSARRCARRRPGARAATGASQPASCTTATPTRSARATCSSRAPRRTGRRPRSWPATWTR